jgi:hypothetical protein
MRLLIVGSLLLIEFFQPLAMFSKKARHIAGADGVFVFASRTLDFASWT